MIETNTTHLLLATPRDKCHQRYDTYSSGIHIPVNEITGYPRILFGACFNTTRYELGQATFQALNHPAFSTAVTQVLSDIHRSEPRFYLPVGERDSFALDYEVRKIEERYQLFTPENMIYLFQYSLINKVEIPQIIVSGKFIPDAMYNDVLSECLPPHSVFMITYPEWDESYQYQKKSEHLPEYLYMYSE